MSVCFGAGLRGLLPAEYTNEQVIGQLRAFVGTGLLQSVHEVIDGNALKVRRTKEGTIECTWVKDPGRNRWIVEGQRLVGGSAPASSLPPSLEPQIYVPGFKPASPKTVSLPGSPLDGYSVAGLRQTAERLWLHICELRRQGGDARAEELALLERLRAQLSECEQRALIFVAN